MTIKSFEDDKIERDNLINAENSVMIFKSYEEINANQNNF